MSVEKRVAAYLELATKDAEAAGLLLEDGWPERLHSFAGYSAYATAFRYPTTGGRIPADPPADALRRDILSLQEFIATVRVELLGSASDR